MMEARAELGREEAGLSDGQGDQQGGGEQDAFRWP